MIRELFQQLGRLFTWIIVVAPWEQALRVRCGKHVRLLSSGIYLRIPLFDRVYRQPTRRRITMIRQQTITTTDGKAITLSASVGFSICDLELLYRSLHDPHDTIEAEIAGCISEFVSQRTKADVNMADVIAHLRESIALEKYGLTGAEYNLINFVETRIYRLITGDLPTWHHGKALETNEHDDTNEGSR